MLLIKKNEKIQHPHVIGWAHEPVMLISFFAVLHRTDKDPSNDKRCLSTSNKPGLQVKENRCK
jgi:hypothetical protein